ncbi:MAG: preprotein translocase subunit SecA [Chloroflexi bacterium]|nr:MAG: preprotein translocase subunit SecA [Chloroflexota bacterium]
MFNILRKLMGDPNERALKGLWPFVHQTNALADEVVALDEAGLRARTDMLRERLAAGEALTDVLPDAMATIREAIARVTGERAYDVQILGAVALHQGAIAEMKTGEGKTLVAAITLFVNALTAEGAHLITVNDYLARRDAQWYGPALHMLGMQVGVLQHDTAYLYTPEAVSREQGMEHLLQVTRREAYAADITYGTNNEYGFDYLRDNMAQSQQEKVQRALAFAIVDEADSVLIDEARTPLIISGPQQDDLSTYPRFARFVPSLTRDVHYTVDERTRSVHLTEAGVESLESKLGIENIYAPENFRLTRYMEAALKAQIIYQRDRDYVVKDGEIVIVDDFTGRLMEGRRWSDGLHQAVEAKEGVSIQQESITYATITLQNFFRMYHTLSGMTGTAATEAEELNQIYKLEVLTIPTHRPMVRTDLPDLIYRSTEGKFAAVLEDVKAQNALGRPVLVGTVAIETSEQLSDMLRMQGIEHEVLNAKQHAREASIVARAGSRGAVTIATNMAGRGTDIKLEEGVAALGGLHIIGTERHESRRIDNQLRGRSGRQGDPGSSRFYVSFEDDIMRRFAPEWLPGIMARLGMDDDQPLESGMVTRAIETAQQKVEAYNFDIRKHVVDYDDVMNTHRDVIYKERDKVLAGESMRDTVVTMITEEIDALANAHLEGDERDPDTFRLTLDSIVPLGDALPLDDIHDRSADEVVDAAVDVATELYDAIETESTSEHQRLIERLILLQTIDTLWVQHLTAMDEMRQGIGLRAYGSTDPLVAYKREAHDMWDQLMENVRSTVARQIFHARLVIGENGAAPPPMARPLPSQLRESGPAEDLESGIGGAATVTAARPQAVRKVGRNDVCPCGSGLKYKRCHGKNG